MLAEARKRMMVTRIDPALYAEVLALGNGNVSRAVEEALHAWVARKRRSRRPLQPQTADRRTVGGRAVAAA
jgi:hypothetical protein